MKSERWTQVRVHTSTSTIPRDCPCSWCSLSRLQIPLPWSKSSLSSQQGKLSIKNQDSLSLVEIMGLCTSAYWQSYPIPPISHHPVSSCLSTLVRGKRMKEHDTAVLVEAVTFFFFFFFASFGYVLSQPSLICVRQTASCRRVRAWRSGHRIYALFYCTFFHEVNGLIFPHNSVKNRCLQSNLNEYGYVSDFKL